jgi:hypothetical protein
MLCAEAAGAGAAAASGAGAGAAVGSVTGVALVGAEVEPEESDGCESVACESVAPPDVESAVVVESPVVESPAVVVESDGVEDADGSELVPAVVPLEPSVGDAEGEPLLAVDPLSAGADEEEGSVGDAVVLGAGVEPVSAAAGRAIANTQAETQAMSATRRAADRRSERLPTFSLPVNYTSPETLLRSPDVLRAAGSYHLRRRSASSLVLMRQRLASSLGRKWCT